MHIASRHARLLTALGALSLTVAVSGSSIPATATTTDDTTARQQTVSVSTETQSGRFDQVMDLVHVDTNPREASVHGWWQDPNKNFPGKRPRL